jgi:hypothetical protein
MRKTTELATRAGCLISVFAPIVGIVLYPRAKWLFALMLIGVGIVVFNALTSKSPTPQELADVAERILSGNCYEWDVDDYMHTNPRDPKLKDLWHRTMAIGGLPEEWVRLDESRKHELEVVIQQLRALDITAENRTNQTDSI